MKLKKGLYLFILAVFLLTACGKAKPDAKKEQVKTEQEESKEQNEEMIDTDESSENTADDTDSTKDLQKK